MSPVLTEKRGATLLVTLNRPGRRNAFDLDYDTLAELEASAQALALRSDYHRDAVGRFLAKKPLAFRWDPAKAPARKPKP